MPEMHPLYRVRRTVHQMLRDRGYMVDAADIDMSEDDFKAKYGENPPREALTVLVQKRDDPTDQLFVFWPQDPKVGVKPIKRCAARGPPPPALPPRCSAAARAAAAGTWSA